MSQVSGLCGQTIFDYNYWRVKFCGSLRKFNCSIVKIEREVLLHVCIDVHYSQLVQISQVSGLCGQTIFDYIGE